jgi:hypothetical protein
MLEIAQQSIPTLIAAAPGAWPKCPKTPAPNDEAGIARLAEFLASPFDGKNELKIQRQPTSYPRHSKFHRGFWVCAEMLTFLRDEVPGNGRTRAPTVIRSRTIFASAIQQYRIIT